MSGNNAQGCFCCAQAGLLVDFDNSGGHAVLIMKAGELPTLLNADFTFRSEELVKGDQVRALVASKRHSDQTDSILQSGDSLLIRSQFALLALKLSLTTCQRPLICSYERLAYGRCYARCPETFPQSRMRALLREHVILRCRCSW